MVGANLLLSPSQPYLEEARDAIIDAIDAAQSNKPISQYLPENIHWYFDKFGRSLRDGEAIEFATSKQDSPARLTKETRRKLVLAATSATLFTENVVLFGTVPEADQDRGTFQIQLADSRKIIAPIGEHREEIVKAFNEYPHGTRVRVQGIAKVDRAERLHSIDSVENVTVLEELDTAARLDELKVLKNGWFEGTGKAPPTTGLDWLAAAFESYFDLDQHLPYIFPTIDGGVRAEWSISGHEISLDINLSDHSAIWHSWAVGSDTEDVRKLSLDDANEWAWLGKQIRTAAGALAI